MIFKLLHTFTHFFSHLHPLFTHDEISYPNMGQSHHFWCPKACTMASESKFEIIRVILPMIRARGPQSPLQELEWWPKGAMSVLKFIIRERIFKGVQFISIWSFRTYGICCHRSYPDEIHSKRICNLNLNNNKTEVLTTSVYFQPKLSGSPWWRAI